VTNQEKHALRKIIEDSKGIVTAGPSFNEKMEMTSSGDPSSLHDDPRYRLGWERCYNRMKQLIEFMLTANNKDLIKYSGRAKKGVK
jgi:hypothetical protein